MTDLADAVVATAPLTSAAAADVIRADIEDAIVSGALAPGTRLNADELARSRGVSHIPVREALRALEADGWVVRRHHRGTFVRDRDPAELADLFEARLAVEPYVTGLAAQRRSADQLDVLEEILRRQEAAGEPAMLAAINCEFHVAVAECAHNQILCATVADLNKRVRFYYVPAAASRHDSSLAEHRAIVDALRTRDDGRARLLIEKHIADTRTQSSRAITDTAVVAGA